MVKQGFDPDKYIEEQSKYIIERIKKGNSERLYLEFGGKLVHDKHAMRVLPGFDENAKVKLLERMKDQAEIIICIYSGDIVNSKTRQDFGITYDLEVLRLIDIFRKHDLKINSVVPVQRRYKFRFPRYSFPLHHSGDYPFQRWRYGLYLRDNYVLQSGC